MKLVYDKVKEVLLNRELNYEFDSDNPHHQFTVYMGIEGFSSIDLYLYLNEDEFLFSMVLEKVKINKGLYEVINEWNKESLLFKLYIGEENYLMIESYHCYTKKEDIEVLLNLCFDSFADELQFFLKIKDYLIEVE